MQQFDIILAGIIGIFFIVLLFKLKNIFFSFPYQKNQFLFTKAESHFFSMLSKAIGQEFVIMGKVRIADVISVSATSNKSRMFTAFNKIACKHFDYVLLDKSLHIVAAVELDDNSHNRDDRKARDFFVEKVCQKAKLPLVRIKTKKYYLPNELKKSVYDALNSI